MDSSANSTEDPCRSRDGSPGAVPPTCSSRRTTHARNQGGLLYGLGVAWAQLRPFLPFVLISCLVVVLVYLLHAIVYSGPFTDPLFFQKFEQRWPRPSQNLVRDPAKDLVETLEASKNISH